MSISETRYARTTVTALVHEEALEAVEVALAEEGFGVLSRIDVAATLKARLGVERPPYVILGACSPQLAHGALEAEPLLGTLLPCNVVVHDDERGRTNVSVVSARGMLGLVGNPDLDATAGEVDERLGRVLDALATG